MAGPILLTTLALVSLLGAQQQVQPQADQKVAFDHEDTDAIARSIERSISRGRLPGGVVWIESGGSIYKKALGEKAKYPSGEKMALDTIFDAASLTKVVATTPSVMKLVEQGKLRLDEPVQKIIPELHGDPNKARITLRHLLTHTSGLPAGVRRGHEWSGYKEGLAQACAERSSGIAGLSYRYSDINFILLGEIVTRVSGKPLDEFAKREVFAPLKMKDTGFRPSSSIRTRIAPTTKMPDGSVLRGVVHDPTSRAMGGVTGHAGLFTTAADLARYARMMLGGGELDGVRVLKEETVAMMTKVQSPAPVTTRRGLGWDIDSPYAGPRGEIFPRGSYGHTGWTGTSLWIDPFSRTFVMLLSNRNHPTESGRVVSLRHQISTQAAKAIRGFDFEQVAGALPEVRPAAKLELAQKFRLRRGKVLNGVDTLEDDDFAALRGMKVGLITNHTGRTRGGATTIDLLHRAKDVKLVALFSPEHGIRGTADEAVGDGRDKRTGLPIHSLYKAKSRKPTAAQLAGLEALVFDIQDIGCRFYTYISTMGLCMEAAQQAGIKFIVLDRVNPIGGTNVAGPVRAGEESFVAFHTIPIRHGMTVGEMARLFKAERCPQLDLKIVPVKNWKRSMLFDQTGLKWVNPSPNIRNLNQAIIYPGVGILEFTNLSVGRGTRSPFELVGAPYIDGATLARELRNAGLKGFEFVPVKFTPESSVFKGKACGGVRILVKDPQRCTSVLLGIELGRALARLYPKTWQSTDTKLNKLLVHQPTVRAIRANRPRAEIERSWQPSLAKFLTRRKKVLLY